MKVLLAFTISITLGVVAIGVSLPAPTPSVVSSQVVNDAATPDATPTPILRLPGEASRSLPRKVIATPTPKPTPKPTPVVKKKASPAPAAPKPATKKPSAAPVVRTSTGWAAAASAWTKYPAWVESFALCVAKHESMSAGLWTAQNPVSSASGAFQYIDSSWVAYSRSAGLGGYSRAKYAPPVVQARVFAHTVTEYGLYPWKGTNCGGGT